MPIFVMVALGMATLLCLGGILNLARFAFRPAFDVLGLLGLMAAGFAGTVGLRERTGRRFEWRWAQAVAPLALLVVGWFVARYLTPVSAFNWHDDFERYFSYPVTLVSKTALKKMAPRWRRSEGRG